MLFDYANHVELPKPGMTFREVSEKSWPIPDECLEARYPSMIHGVGLADEYRSIKYWSDFADDGYDGVLAPA
ncbi:MAG: hypothetical protein M5U09_10085 [Gammaproteobacteria bacterium]|nr:hypothetical protein [Gammaproteobacteria bacterium]